MTRLRLFVVVIAVILLALAVALLALAIRGPAPPPVSLYGGVDSSESHIPATPGPPPRRQHVVVQFERTPTGAERRRIEAQAFVRFVASVPRNAYIVGFATQRRDEVDAALSRAVPRVVRFIALGTTNRLSPAFDLRPSVDKTPGIQINCVPKYDKEHPRTCDGKSIRVRIFGDVPTSDAMRTLQKYDDSPTVVGEGLWGLEVTRAQIAALAGEDSVQFISPDPGEPTNDLKQARTILNVDPGVTETGVNVTIAQREGAHPARHNAFESRLTITDPSLNPAPPQDDVTHATMVAGILAGDGAAEDARDKEYYGIAPAVNLRAYSAASSINADQQYQDAVSASATIANNSWGYNWFVDHFHLFPQAYTDLSYLYDVLSSGRDEIGNARGPGGRLLVVGSAGNLGYAGPIVDPRVGYVQPWSNARIGNSAKDAIAVGNVAEENGQTVPPFPSCTSGRGPTIDGRITPTLVAPGDEVNPAAVIHIRSTSAPGQYGEDQGTSFSAPMISGAAALLTERIHNSCPRQPTPTDLRALLVHTAVDLTDANSEALPKERPDRTVVTWKVAASECGHSDATAAYVGPDFVFGWGLADVKSAIAAAGQYVNGAIECGGSIEYRIVVHAPSERAPASPLKVTLVWDDPPYAVNAVPAADTGVLQNDLDLELVAPDGRIFLPWHLDAANPAAPATRASFAVGKSPDDSARDHRNTIEQVVVDAADRQSGEWDIRVRASQMQLGPQSFTLVSDVFSATACGQTAQGTVVGSDHPMGTWFGLVPWLFAGVVILGVTAFVIVQAESIGSGVLLVAWAALVSFVLFRGAYLLAVVLVAAPLFVLFAAEPPERKSKGQNE